MWGSKPRCPYCNRADKIYDFKSRPIMRCGICNKQFSIRKNTIFDSSRLPLTKWFYAIYLFTAHKKGIRSRQLARDLNAKQQTAWYMLQRIRSAMENAESNTQLDGIVEADETYIGGKEINKHLDKRTKGTQGRSTKTKDAVFGMIERKGAVKAYAMDKVNGKNVKGKVVEYVARGAVVITDDFGAYNGIDAMYDHKQVNHSSKEYVKDTAHTNSIESFWAHFKRGVMGIYYHMSKKHLQRYVNEFTMRYNTRDISDKSRFDIAISHAHGVVRYADLTKA